MNKKKIINDPLYGFITIPDDLIYDIINHPFFQRLRRIKQLGLTDFVYPGALHTRFHHALGAMHLMQATLDNLRQKGIEIDDQEYQSALLAMLLHDIGHAPFSHALEHVLLSGVNHEVISGLIIRSLNAEFDGALDMAIQMYTDKYERHFFKQLVSSQLDIDRIDYLNRDSYFTGVVEGRISAERIIKLLNVRSDNIVVEEKGIYSVENFLSARRLMYWQVYLHKTVVAVETMIVQIVRRARYLNDSEITANEWLRYFLLNDVTERSISEDTSVLENFCALDDYDLMGAIKIWRNHSDPILRSLCRMLTERKLFKVLLSESSISPKIIQEKRLKLLVKTGESVEAADFLIVNGEKSNAAYIGGGQKINVLTRKGEIFDIAMASDLPNIKAMRKIVKKYYLCWPKVLNL